MAPSVVVWWTIDSLRRDVCSTYDGPAATPSLSRLAKRGEAFLGRSEATWTLPSVTSILTGQPPEEHGVETEHDRLRPGTATLPQHFRFEGWRTIGLVANPWFTRRKGLDIGFDSFYNITEDGSVLREVSIKSAINYLARLRSLNGGLTIDRDRHPSEPLMADLAAERLNQASRPVFMMLHTQGAHSPYNHPSGWNNHRNGTDERKRAYLNLVEFVDAQLGRFVGRLGDDALLILTSDHGEALGESGKWGHKAPELSVLYDVPLVINQPCPQFSDPVSHVAVHKWLREEVAPEVEGPAQNEELEERLEALGYRDGEHSV